MIVQLLSELEPKHCLISKQSYVDKNNVCLTKKIKTNTFFITFIHTLILLLYKHTHSAWDGVFSNLQL